MVYLPPGGLHLELLRNKRTIPKRIHHKHRQHQAPHQPLAVVQKPNETTRKYIERFNAECKTIDGLVDGVASLCLTNGLANDEFRKQLTTKPVWTRKEMQVISKEFIHREEVDRVVAATKNTQAHTAPRGPGQTSHPRDNHRDNGPRGNPKPPRQKFDNYTPLVASIEGKNPKRKEQIPIIREPRTSDREQSSKSESRNPRFRRDDNEPIMEITVITGSSAPEKSKSALKKDLKILATMQTPLHCF
ncbi:hypothetical protein PIB30_085065 [Stylosanthes scabra]|uniref:Uncharacterized protein n=1 Tax=Stylosanthes scabra TaxID=79078 RepID=A0ABU6XRR9_9FABA|nr:hypothetical protein [Stylosanthes scabra]